MLIPLADIQAARDRLAPLLPTSPLVRAASYSDRVGAEVLFKLELLLPTHAFKVRGALNALLLMEGAARSRGVVTASGGNHGLGLAYAAKLLEVRSTVVVPTTTPTIRVETIRRLGGTVIVWGGDWNAANRYALGLCETQGATYVSPFDDPNIMAGQGTIALELLEQAPDTEVVVCSVGGGGLISGVASALRQLRPEVRVVGVETLGADCMSQSLAAGRLVELPHFTSIAESLGTKRSAERPFAIVREAVERIVTVSDARAFDELLWTLNQEKLLCEPAASCALAALTDAVPDLGGRKVAVILCGGNITLEQVSAWAERFGRASGVREAAA